VVFRLSVDAHKITKKAALVVNISVLRDRIVEGALTKISIVISPGRLVTYTDAL
jgi:hypothetical protein